MAEMEPLQPQPQSSQGQSQEDQSITSNLYFLDTRLVNGGRFTCASWKEDEDEAGSSNEPDFKLLKLPDASLSGAYQIFTEYQLLKLHKFELTTGVFRQKEVYHFPADFTTHLPNLKCLTIDLSLPSISWISPVRQDVQLNRNTGKNLVKIFKVLDSPALSSFHFKTNEDKYRKANWEVEVFEFLKTKPQLKVLDLDLGNNLQKRRAKQSISGVHPQAPLEVLFIQYKPNTQYQWTSTCTSLPNFWTPLLNQGNLVTVDLMGIPNINICDLQLLIRKNESSLQVLRFQHVFCSEQRRCKFDCDSLRKCTRLRHFAMNPGFCNVTPRRPKSIMTNFRLIPASIISLSISNVNLCTSVFLKVLKDLKNLQVLQLVHCGSTETRGVSVCALKALLRLRKLDKLTVAPILIANKADANRLTRMEARLKRADPQFSFLRHIMYPTPLQKPENLNGYLRYCPTA